MAAIALTVASLVVAAYGTHEQLRSSRSAARAQRKQVRASNAITRAEEQRARQQQIAEARRRRALVASLGAFATPGGTSSGEQGGSASIFTQQASNLSFLNATSQLQERVANAGSSAARHGARASIFGSVAGFATNVAGMSSAHIE